MKTIDEIYQEMARTYTLRTGMELNGSCDTAVRLYAVAAQVYALYVQGDWVARQAFPQTAEGEYLDRHAALRGLERKVGAAAQGVVRFENSTAAAQLRIIPKGTVCMTAGLVRFETVEKAVLPAGALYVDVPVRAVEAGSAGNVSAGTITSMAVAPLGVSSCSNPEACVGGEDAEEDETLRQRILDTYRRLPNGANAAYYEALALSIAGVEKVLVQPRKRGRGTVDIVFSASYGCPTAELVEQVAQLIGENREICVDTLVSAPTTRSVDVEAELSLAAGYDVESVKSAAEKAVEAYFGGDKLGESIYAARISSILMGLEGVENCRLKAPAEDIAAQAEVLPVAGHADREHGAPGDLQGEVLERADSFPELSRASVRNEGGRKKSSI